MCSVKRTEWMRREFVVWVEGKLYMGGGGGVWGGERAMGGGGSVGVSCGVTGVRIVPGNSADITKVRAGVR